jgi:hypothetical protein
VDDTPVVKGNIDITKRPKVVNPDGSVSTVRSMTIGVGDKHVVIPTVSDDGRIMTDDEAIETFFKTRRHLGMFESLENAEKYSQTLHKQQERYYLGEPGSPFLITQDDIMGYERRDVPYEYRGTVTPPGGE